MPNLLEIRNLAVSFNHGAASAVRRFDLAMQPGEIVGLVGESGSGKTITALSLMGLLPPGAKMETGELIFKGRNLAGLTPAARRELCGRHMGLVFQEPMTALNPVLTIGEQAAEIFRRRDGASRREAKRRTLELLGRVGLPHPKEAARGYPHRFSGGMRQRVVLALALALSPELLIADEPTTALDPTIAAQILALIKKLTTENQAAVLFITHNLRLLAGLARRILVMYGGLVVEEAPAGLLFADPQHPYTQGLLAALPPGLDSPVVRRLTAIPGLPPHPADRAAGCAFAPRCPAAQADCRSRAPELYPLNPERKVRCLRHA